MRLIAKILSLLLFLGSVAILALVTLALRNGYSSDWFSALYEGFETIPEGLLMAMGMRGSPVWVDVLYWVLIVVALLAAWKNSGCNKKS